MLYTASYNRTSQGGFSLVEMLIVIGIITLITSAVLVRQSSFNNTTVLQNAAYEVAFDIRQAQSRAVSPQVGTGDLRGGYGIRFLTDNMTYEIFQRAGTDVVPVESRRIDPRFRLNITESIDAIFFERPDFDARFKSGGTEISGMDAVDILVSMDGETSGYVVTVTSVGQITVSRSDD